MNVTICEPWRENVSNAPANCGLHWCDSKLSSLNTSEGCACFRDDSEKRITTCTALDVKVQLTGNAGKFTLNGSQGALEEFVLLEYAGTQSVQWLSADDTTRPSLVYEHWESGVTYIEGLTKMPTARALQSPGVKGTPGCVERLFCFCGERQCLDPSGHKAMTRKLVLPKYNASRRLDADSVGAEGEDDEGRRLSFPSMTSLSAQTAGQDTREVVVIYGITPPVNGMLFEGTPQWSFDALFEPESPWSQRAMLAMCTDTPAELNIVAKDCWIDDFRKWLNSQGLLFPVQRFGSFDTELKRYIGTSNSASSKMWLNTEGSMRATRLFMKIKLEEDHSVTLKSRKRWLDYVQAMNDVAVSTASAWVASQAWVDAEAYDEALVSTWRVTGLTLAGIFVAGFVYILDFEMLMIMVGICFVAFIYLAFFMFCLFGWEFGPWELILMCVFLTYSVEPAFRIARDFVSAPQKKWRNEDEPQLAPLPPLADFTVGHVGSLVVEDGTGEFGDSKDEGSLDIPEDLTSEGSGVGDPADDSPEAALRRALHHQSGAVIMGSIKVFLCCWFLLPCDFRLFTRLGAVGIVVSFAQVVCTLVLLPAALLVSGRSRREPDIYPIGRFLHDKLAWVWT